MHQLLLLHDFDHLPKGRKVHSKSNQKHSSNLNNIGMNPQGMNKSINIF